MGDIFKNGLPGVPGEALRGDARHCTKTASAYSSGPMQGSLRLLTAVALSASLLTACGRKKEEQVESTPPAEQPAEAAQPAVAPASVPNEGLQQVAAAPAQIIESSPQVEIPVPPDAPVATPPQTVPTELAQSDALYEAWFRKYNLDLNDPNMLDADADGDGVSNGDEFMADTNPRDAKSMPARAAAAKVDSHSGLKLKKYTEVQVPVVLEEIEGNTARIRRLDQEDKVETVRAGQTLEGLGLKVEKVRSRRMTDKHGSTVDASQVTLEDPETNKKTLLVKDMPARSSASYAVLTSEDGESSITVHQGESFEWPKGSGTTYTVMDLRDDQAVLQDESTGRTWTVKK